MNHSANRSKIDQTVEHLTALAADAPNPARGRSNRQRNQGYESRKGYGDEGALGDVFPHGGEIERLVRSEVGEEVQRDVEEGEEAKYAAEADEVGELEKFTERRDAKGEDEKAEGPITGGVLQELHGIGAEIALDDAPNQIAEGDEAKKKNGDFGPFADENCAHAEGPP